MTRLVIGLTVTVLAWNLAVKESRSEGLWHRVEDKTNCVSWIDAPLENLTMTWTGVCERGKTSGQGSIVWRFKKEGVWVESYFTGNMEAGKIEGSGRLKSRKGWIYEGGFKNHAPSGYGEMVWPTGSSYKGQWNGWNRHGHGTLVYGNTGLKFVGEFRSGKKHGNGVATSVGGSKFVGDYVNDRAEGPGIFTLKNGEQCEGIFHNGEMVGRGTGKLHGKTFRCRIDIKNDEIVYSE